MKRLLFSTSRLFGLSRTVSYFPISNYSSPPTIFSHQVNYYHPSDDGEPTGFIRTFINKFREGMEEDESLLENIEELESTGTAQVIKETAATTKEGAKYLYDQTEGVREEVRKGAEMAGDGIYQTVDVIGKGMDAIAESAVIKGMIDELNRDYELLRTAHFSFRSEYARRKDAEDGIFYNPYSKQFEEMTDHNLDEETGTVVIVEDPTIDPTQEGELAPQGAFGILRGTINSLGDKVFKPTAQSEALTRIKQRNPDFNMDLFVGNVENILIPILLDSYFDDNKGELKRVLSESAYRERIWPLIQERKEREIKFDTKIIKLSNVEFFKALFVDKEPYLQILFQIQYIHCLRDFDGNIVEGGIDDIRMVGHQLSIIQDITKETNDWEIIEWVFGQALRIPA